MKRFAVLLLAFLFAAPAQAAESIALWGTPKYADGFHHFDYANASAPKGGSMKLSTSAAFDSMNPYILKGIAAPGVDGYVYQSLMVPSYDEPMSYYPLIASSITVAPDHAYADFTLNPKAHFSDGVPITSDDVVWSFNMFKTKGHPTYKVRIKTVTIEARGPHAVRFHFADKEHRELPLVAAATVVLPKHYFCEGNGNKTGCIAFDKTTLALPIGSGPYKVSNVEAGRSITFTRDPDYWAADLPTQRGFNNFDTIRYDVYRDDTVALEGLKSHQFDYYEEFIARNWATAYNIPAVKSGQMVKTLIPNKIPRGMQGFIFNTRLSKFSDVRVREAIGLTLDFEWMNQTLFYGAYERGKSFFNNTEFEAKGLPGADELKLLEPYRCSKNTGSAAGAASPLVGEATRLSVSEGALSRSGEGAEQIGTQLHRPLTHPSPTRGEGTPASPPEPRATSHESRTTPSSCLPASIFTAEYTVPTTDGSGFARDNLIRAQQLLDDAGWIMRDGKRVNEKTGEQLTIEFLMTQKTFERVIAIMRQNLRKLGIDSTFRYVDASQYQKRVEKKQFDIVSVWWNLGLFYPSTEQYLYWHSSQADIEGSQNFAGTKNPAIDDLTTRIQNAQNLTDLRAASRALDRVLTHEYYIVPHWNLSAWRVAYWNQFGRPKVTPAYSLGLDTWWAKDAEKGGAK